MAVAVAVANNNCITTCYSHVHAEINKKEI